MTVKIQKKKKQHFVPQFYLRNFSSNSKTANIFHLKSGKIIESPIDSTCQESHFYGADGEFEDFLTLLDDLHSKTITEIIQSKSLPLTDNARIALLQFLLVQHTRTRLELMLVEDYGDAICDKYLKPTLQSYLRSKGMDEQKIEGYTVKIENMDILHKQAILDAMNSIIGIRDLIPCIVNNYSNIPFITSDSPVIFNNRIHLDNNFTGLLSKGLQIHCPLNPHMYLLFYDPDFYTIDYSETLNLDDINRLNALQLLHCNEILIIPDGMTKEYLDSLCAQYMSKKKRKNAEIQTKKSEWLDERTRNDIDEFTIENANSHLNFNFLKFNHKEYRRFKPFYLKTRRENPLAVFPRDLETVRELEKYKNCLEEKYHTLNDGDDFCNE